MTRTTDEEFDVQVPPAPFTKVEDVVDTYHGVEVHDPYRWLESDSPERTRWLEEQDRRARAVFAAIPGRDALREAIREADRGVTEIVLYGVVGAAPRLFFLKRTPDEDQGSIWIREGWEGEERLLVDPRTRDHDGVHFSVDYAQPSWDGRFLAYGISPSGSEDSIIEILEVDSGKLLEERIDRAQYAHISWRPDNRSFFYWRRAKPAPDAQPKDWFKNSATFLHHLGDDPEEAVQVFGAALEELGLSRTRIIGVEVSPASGWAVAGASSGTSADREFFVAPLAAVVPGADIPWRRVSGPDDQLSWTSWIAAYEDRLFALSHDGAPRFQVLELDARSASLADARVFIPEGETVIETFVAAQDALYVQHLDRGLSRLERVSWDGTQREFLSLPFDGSVFDLSGRTDRPCALD
jgi:prolyl oligopeptidase